MNIKIDTQTVSLCVLLRIMMDIDRQVNYDNVVLNCHHYDVIIVISGMRRCKLMLYTLCFIKNVAVHL